MKFNKVGVRYCIRHHGIANEDDTVCDFSHDETGRCTFRQLGYRTTWRT
jgi:hypothetical protein